MAIKSGNEVGGAWIWNAAAVTSDIPKARRSFGKRWRRYVAAAGGLFTTGLGNSAAPGLAYCVNFFDSNDGSAVERLDGRPNVVRRTRPVGRSTRAIAMARQPAVLNSLRLLIVEDSPDVREIFALLAEEDGADVTVVSGGHDAIAAISTHVFDVVVCDLGLPDIPGDRVISEIRRCAQVRPRLIALTGYDEPYLTRARTAGADIVLTKPVSWPRLLAAFDRPKAGIAAA